MPIHDWTRVDAGLFHAFHQSWIIRLCDALNAGRLPADYFALPEQSIKGPVLDVLARELSADAEDRIYVRKANRIAVRHRHGQIVAVAEIVSPGNKASKSELRTFVEKCSDLIMQRVHLLVIDLFPPSKRDPQGIHKTIWDEFIEEDFELPAGKPLTLAAYDAGPPPVAYVEPVGLGDVLPDMPIFLKPEFYVPAPLEASYQHAWDHFPAPMKRLLEPLGGNPGEA
jgi:Protein of unknown function (DUF4058)